MEICDTQDAFEQWRTYLLRLELDQLFDNPALKQRALDLHRRNTCIFHAIEPELFSAEVVGVHAVYWVELHRKGTQLRGECSCPSYYKPCKHIGALLYTIQALPAVKDFRPGEVLDVTPVDAPLQEAFSSSAQDPFFPEFMLPRSPGKCSETACFRLAFRLSSAQNFQQSMVKQLLIEPVLVYLRKNGADGRIVEFKPGIFRRRGDEASEKLLSRIAGNAEFHGSEWEASNYSPSNYSSGAMGLCRYWCTEAFRRGAATMEIPVELYLERPSRLCRELPAVPRRIDRIGISWRLEGQHQQQLYYWPILELYDKADYCEKFDAGQLTYEQDIDALLVVTPSTGSLWHLFQLEIPETEPGKIQAVATMLYMLAGFTAAEARTFSDLCHSRFSGLVEVAPVPLNLRLISLVPMPVANFHMLGGGTEESTYIEIQLFFRYRGEELRYPGRNELISVTLEEARAILNGPQKLYGRAKAAAEEAGVDGNAITIEGGGGGRDQDSTGARPNWFISTDSQVEDKFTRILRSTIRNHNGTDTDKADFSLDGEHFSCSQELYDALSGLGRDLQERGFELQLERQKLHRPPGTPGVYVTGSGELWLKLEAGFLINDDFVPLEDIPARGIVRAGGKLYVLPQDSDMAALCQAVGNKRVGRRDFAGLDSFIDHVLNPNHPGLEDFFSLKERLASFSQLQETEVPTSFRGTLRPYQRSGLSWLWFLHSYKLGGCLADDMGLGKTIQALSLLAKVHEEEQLCRVLVVCPVCTLGNWQNECRRFTPQFSTAVHAGPQRARTAQQLCTADIVLVSYATLYRDAELMKEADFNYLILDEAQAIKNPRAKRRKAVAAIPAQHRLALTGTPMENNTLELWSLIDILIPGILGSRTNFTKRYGEEIEIQGSDTALESLLRIIRPLVLRRTKAAVAPELPPREEVVLYAEAGRRQSRVYESLRQRYEREVKEAMDKRGVMHGGKLLLEAMLRLRQAAILPALVDSEYNNVPSAKLDLLYDRLVELRDEENKALVFSQFTSVLDEVELRLSGSGLQLMRLDGSTPQSERDRQIGKFQGAEGAACFLISLKAGGVGINLTAADYIFLLDPWWNPAVETQAIDRAHRIGRVGRVLAYRLITKGTIEEKIMRLQAKKRSLSERLIQSEGGALRSLSAEDIQSLFSREEGYRSCSGR